MIGVLLISHGAMADGMKDSISLFIPEVKQFNTLALKADDDPEEFRQLIEQNINDLDTGEGVIIFADMLGGTPANQAAYLMNENVNVITGMNLSIVLECLTLREHGELSMEQLSQVGKEGIVHLNKLFD